MKKVIAFTIADRNNEKYYSSLRNSLRKFHSDEELPLVLIGQEELDKISDPMKFYRATPHFAQRFSEYELVLKIDIDSIITAPLTEILENKDYDLGVVLNSNPREFKKWKVQVWNIPAMAYFNCGFVAMRSKEFIDHWWSLCNKPMFNDYPYKEQDLLNIIIHYGNYKVECFDNGSYFYGLASNSYWNHFELRGDDIVLPVIKEENTMWPMKEKKIAVLHFAEGQASLTKGNYRIKVSEEVSKRLDFLTHE